MSPDAKNICRALIRMFKMGTKLLEELIGESDNAPKSNSGGGQMRKALGVFVAAMVTLGATALYAQDRTVIHPTYPGTTTRDYSKPSVVVERNTVYQTYPGTTTRDYRRPGAIMQGDTLYPTYPGTNTRDYSRPGWVVEQEE